MPRSLKAGARRLRDDEGGFTLPELLVAAMLSLFVVGSAVMVFTSAIQSEPRTADRTAQIQQARTLAEMVSRELRQGWDTPTMTSSQLAVLTYVKRVSCSTTTPSTTSIPCRVTYNCSTGDCTRTTANVNGTGAGSPVKVVEDLSSTAVFTYSPSGDPTFVGIRVTFADDDGQDSITLEDGVAFRNPGAPST